MTSRDVARAVRAAADKTSADIQSVAAPPQFFATVASVAPLMVTWRGANVRAAGKGSNYTPVVGQRVNCSLIRNQLIVHHAIDGQP